jgi:hypothetical protein
MLKLGRVVAVVFLLLALAACPHYPHGYSVQTVSSGGEHRLPGTISLTNPHP